MWTVGPLYHAHGAVDVKCATVSVDGWQRLQLCSLLAGNNVYIRGSLPCMMTDNILCLPVVSANVLVVALKSATV